MKTLAASNAGESGVCTEKWCRKDWGISTTKMRMYEQFSQNGWFMTGWFRGTPFLGNPNINHYWIFLIIHTGWASEILHRLVDGKHPWKASHYIFTVFQESQKPLLIRLSLIIGYPNNLMIHHPFPKKKPAIWWVSSFSDTPQIHVWLMLKSQCLTVELI